MIPTIDPTVRYGSTSLLREIAREIKAGGVFSGAAVINDGIEPVAVVVSYDAFIAMQNELDSLGGSTGEGMEGWRERLAKA